MRPIGTPEVLEAMEEVEITFDVDTSAMIVHRHPKWSADFARRVLDQLQGRGFGYSKATGETVHAIRSDLRQALLRRAVTQDIYEMSDGFWYHFGRRMILNSPEVLHECGGPEGRCMCPAPVVEIAKPTEPKEKEPELDWLNQFHGYWSAVLKQALTEGYLHRGIRHRGKTAVDLIRGTRYRARQRSRLYLMAPKHKMSNPIEDYGEKIGRAVKSKLDALVKSNGDPCIDNYRWCRLDNNNERRRYSKAKARGCCGFADHNVTIKGVEFRLGFNYGH